MDKKTEIGRIVIYYVLAFAITFVWYVVFNDILSGDRYGSYSEDGSNAFHSFAGFSMLGPAIAVFITRAVTKEGMKNNMLKFNIKGNIKYYLLSVLVFICIDLAAAFIIPIYLGIPYSPEYSASEIIRVSLMMLPLTVFEAVSIYFGEEYGWRGYLYPKLESLFGITPAILISSVLWGFWHLPMLLNGHNFGRDLPLFPFTKYTADDSFLSHKHSDPCISFQKDKFGMARCHGTSHDQ